MSISILGQIGALEVLSSTRELIVEHGHAGHAAYDQYAKKYSLFGALASTCGASIDGLVAYQGDLMDLKLRGQKLGVFVEVVVFLESLVDCDLEEWCEDASTEDVLTLIDRACDRIKIAVT